MPKEFKPGWKYINSAALGQEIALHLQTGRVYCSDGVQYTPEEVEIIKKSSGKINPLIHRVKSLFKGTIVG